MALERVRAAEGEGRQYFSCDEVPIEGVVRPKWRDIIIEEAPDGGTRINRINYEICILQTLREKLRCKEVWVDGAHRFRNPTTTCPPTSQSAGPAATSGLGLPTDAQAFTAGVKAEMTEALAELNRTMPRNSQVRPPWRRHPISITPLEPQPEPPSLEAVRAELGRRWPMTGLLDILKEADLRIRFTDAFSTAASREATNKEEVRRRLLLCLYGLGTNAGLKRLAVGDHGFSHKELLHTRRRYVDTDSLDATRRVVNATLAVRDPAPGRGHDRVRGRLHPLRRARPEPHDRVARPLRRKRSDDLLARRHRLGASTSLKRCSSSEVASMIEGVLRHDTDAEIDRTYVDSHGQSEVAFAFCKLLGFQPPRLKNIAAQRLYLPEAGVAPTRTCRVS